MEKSAATKAIWVARDPEGNDKLETTRGSKAECFLAALRLFDLDRIGWKIVHTNKPTELMPRKRGKISKA